MVQAITSGNTTVSQPAWLTLLRVALGAILIWKGINFIRDTSALKSLIEQTGIGIFTENSGGFALIITILTLLCGFLILVGLFTRIASIIQIPIILGAILFVNIKNIEQNVFELALTIIVLGLLILFIVKGSGMLSADEYFRRGAAIDKSSDRAFR